MTNFIRIWFEFNPSIKENNRLRNSILNITPHCICLLVIVIKSWQITAFVVPPCNILKPLQNWKANVLQKTPFKKISTTSLDQLTINVDIHATYEKSAIVTLLLAIYRVSLKNPSIVAKASCMIFTFSSVTFATSPCMIGPNTWGVSGDQVCNSYCILCWINVCSLMLVPRRLLFGSRDATK